MHASTEEGSTEGFGPFALHVGCTGFEGQVCTSGSEEAAEDSSTGGNSY